MANRQPGPARPPGPLERGARVLAAKALAFAATQATFRGARHQSNHDGVALHALNACPAPSLPCELDQPLDYSQIRHTTKQTQDEGTR